MRIVCWQMILMKYYTLFFRNLRKMLQNLSSAAVVIGALRVDYISGYFDVSCILLFRLLLIAVNLCNRFGRQDWQNLTAYIVLYLSISNI